MLRQNWSKNLSLNTLLSYWRDRCLIRFFCSHLQSREKQDLDHEQVQKLPKINWKLQDFFWACTCCVRTGVKTWVSMITVAGSVASWEKHFLISFSTKIPSTIILEKNLTSSLRFSFSLALDGVSYDHSGSFCKKISNAFICTKAYKATCIL